MRSLAFYVVPFVILAGGGAVVGFALRRWALLAPFVLAGALAYGWEFYGPALAYAAIAAFIAMLGVVLGMLARRAWSRRNA